MKRLIPILLSIAMLLSMLPLPISAASEPAKLVYQGEEYRFVADPDLELYQVGTAYLFAAEYGGSYYALGSDLSAVPLTLSGDTLSAQSGLAVLTTVTTDGNSSFSYSLPLQVNGGKYLQASSDNVLSLSDAAPDPYCGWTISEGSVRCFISGESWSSKHFLSLPDGAQFAMGSTMPSSPILVYQKVCDHAGKTDYPAADATCTQPGWTAHAFCPACGSWLDAAGNLGSGSGRYWENDFRILPTGHCYVDGFCVNDPEHTARSYELVTSDDMIVTGGQYRYVLVSGDGKVLGVDQRTEYDANAVTGAVIENGILTLDNSADPNDVYAAEFTLCAFVPEDEYMIMPTDGSALYVMATETSRVLIAMGELRLVYDENGDAKYPVGLSVENGVVSLRAWMYGDWGGPAVYDAATGFGIGDTANVKLYRSSVSACDHSSRTEHAGRAPSCTEGGFETFFVCNDCGMLIDGAGTASESYCVEDFYVCPALGHDYDAATGICSRCGEKAPVYEKITSLDELLPDRRYLIIDNETGKALDVPRPTWTDDHWEIPELLGTTVQSVALANGRRTVYGSGGAAFRTEDTPDDSSWRNELGFAVSVAGSLTFVPDYSWVYPSPIRFADRTPALFEKSMQEPPVPDDNEFPITPVNPGSSNNAGEGVTPGENELPVMPADLDEETPESTDGFERLYFSFLSNGDAAIHYFDSAHPFTFDGTQAYGFTQRDMPAAEDEPIMGGDGNYVTDPETGDYVTNHVEHPTGISLWREVAGEPAPAALTVALITDGAPAQDGGFNQAVYDAASAWCAANGAEFVAVEPEELGEDFDYNGAVSTAVNAGATVLLMPGFAMAAVAVENAPACPGVQFILFDVSEDELRDAAGDENYEIPANVYAATYREEQAGFLAGYAAVSLGYRKLAFLGGMALPAVTRYGYGFVQGANAAAVSLACAGELRIDYAYCGQFFPDDAVTAYVNGWYEAGTEIVFSCGGGICASAAAAARSHGGKLIGVDIDQGPAIDADYGTGMTVTSAIKGLGATAAAQLDLILAGSFAGGKAENLGVVSADPAENHVGLAPTTQFGEGFTEADYAALLGRIAGGELTVSDDVVNRPATEIFVDYNCYRGHAWGEPTYVWAEDNAAITATRVCENEAYHVETETVNVTAEVTQPATCTESGKTTYSAAFTNAAFAAQSKTLTDVAALGHNYELTGWSWTGYTAATATFTCKNDANHVLTETAVISSNRTEPTAEANGSVVYTATVTFAGTVYTDSKTEILPALGHDYVLAAWRWAEDFSTATAVFNDNNGGSPLNLEATITSNRTEPTCVAAGKIVYTASVTLGGTTYTDTKTQTLAAPGHTPGEPVKENEIAPTCTEKGGYDTVVYCTVCKAELSREHTETLALGHTPGEPVKENEIAPTCTEKGGYDTVVYCTVCKAELSREHTAIEALGHDMAPLETVAPTCTAYGYTTYKCTRCETYYIDDFVDETGHDWGEPTYEWADDNGSVTATRICKNDESHTETETVNTTSEITRPATVEAEGELTYTAVFENPAFETQTAVEAIPKLVRFEDVSPDVYYAGPVEWAVANGITNGTSATTFSPDKTCTRAQVVTFLWRAKGSPEPTATDNPFTDVTADAYYYKAVLWAVEAGVTSGTSATRFSPDNGCTRAQVVTFLWRAEGKPAPASANNPFTDVQEGQYYFDAVLWAVGKGVTTGTGATTFSPDKTCTRAQVVTFLYRNECGTPD